MIAAAAADCAAAARGALHARGAGEVVATLARLLRAAATGAARGREAAALELRASTAATRSTCCLTRGRGPPSTASRWVRSAGRSTAHVRLRHARHAARRARRAPSTASRVAPARVRQRRSRKRSRTRPSCARGRTRVGRYSDVPLVTWYETDAAGARRAPPLLGRVQQRGRRHAARSADGDLGPADGHRVRLRRRAGRDGRVVSEEFQGRGPQAAALRGRARGRASAAVRRHRQQHGGRARRGDVRFAPAPTRFDLAGVSREAVMDREPWTYRVSAQEVRREGRVTSARASGRPANPRSAPLRDARGLRADAGRDPRVRGRRARRATACAGSRRTAAARSSASRARRIEFPTGCFRGAAALPRGRPAERPRRAALARVHAHRRARTSRRCRRARGARGSRRSTACSCWTENSEPGPQPAGVERRRCRSTPEGPPFEIPIRAKEAR